MINNLRKCGQTATEAKMSWICVQKNRIKTHAVITKIKSEFHQVVQIAIEIKNLGKPGDKTEGKK